MKEAMGNAFTGFRNLSLPKRTAVLAIAVVLLYAIVAPVAWLLAGWSGTLAAAAAAGVCLLGAAPALWICCVVRAPKPVVYGWLLGMVFRTGIPLAFALTVRLKGGGLVEAGVLYYLVVFFTVTLGVETVLSLPGGQPAQRRGSVSQDVS